VKTVAFFNNKGGVGKTTLVYHLMWMFSELGYKVLAADLDPQANLTGMSIDEERLNDLWVRKPRPTIYSAIEPLKKGIGEVQLSSVENVSSDISLILGDLDLSSFEDDLSWSWPSCLDRNERSFRVTTAFARIIGQANAMRPADIGLVDVGPNLGAINRAALIAADYVVIPAAPDLFSVQGLENVGPRLKLWRREWQDRRLRQPPDMGFALPPGEMQPLGYVVSRYSVREGREVKSFRRWLQRLPIAYREKVEGEAVADAGLDLKTDERCLAQLKDYRSLMPMAQEARKPMFLLKPSDGAIGGHQGAVRDCYRDFKTLAELIASKVGLQPRST
jgi:chromosome partitioning protein